MALRKLHAVIFDIGRVLIAVDVARAMEGFAPAQGMSPAGLWTALTHDPRWPDWQEGRISAHDWHLHVTRRLGIQVSFDDFTKAWNQALDPHPLQDEAFLAKLGKKYRMALLSNTDPIHVAHMEATYSFLKLFPTRIYSCGAGASKPNPLVYMEALKGCKVRASEAVYIDDILEYVDAARALGLAGIHYQSTDALVKGLEDLGIHV